MTPRLGLRRLFLICVLFLATACSRDNESISESRYVEPDRLYQALANNVRTNPEFEVIVDIDHSRRAAEAGSSMPPAHVLIWSDPELEAAILRNNPRAGVDLPLRALAFEDQSTGRAAVITNTYDYVARRYSLPEDAGVRTRYEAAIAKAVRGIPDSSVARFPSDAMPDAGLVTLQSTHDFEATERRIQGTIDAQSDAVTFARVDFAARAKEHGVVLNPTALILFGAPGPGGKAMESAPTMGLDAFCQKIPIWQDNSGTVHVTFNDLLALADRQKISVGLPLRRINRRLKKTLSEALEQ